MSRDVGYFPEGGETVNLILTSDGISCIAIEHEIIRLLPGGAAGKRACIVTTASSHKERSNGAVATRQTFLRLGLECADFIDIERDSPDLLQKYDVLYLNGGNPFYLLAWMKKRNVVSILREQAAQGRLVVGMSAGAMVLARSIAHVSHLNRIAGYEPMDVDALTDYEAVGLTGITVVPHYNRFIATDPDFEAKLRKLEKSCGVEFTRVRDGEAVVIEEHKVTFVHA